MMVELIKAIESEIMEFLPGNAEITEIVFEGANLVLYTGSREFFIDSTEIIKKIAKELKKRIEVRPDTEICSDPEDAEKKIRKIVPEGAGITDLSFERYIGKVIIEAEKPGLVIGKNGSTLKELKRKIIWSPSIIRTPPIPSEIVKTVRSILQKESKFRRKFLHRVGNRIYERDSKEPIWIRISALGGFREVGRSALLFQTPESRVLLDCGVNVAVSGPSAYPHLDAPEFDIERLDAVVISHAHLDHSGFVPYLFKFGYDGPIYCTEPTRDLMALLQLDYIDVTSRELGESIYTSNEIKEVIKHTITLKYGEVSDITPDLRLTLYNAGHIIGSCIAHIHVGDGLYNVVYTGDLNFSRSRLLDAAHVDFPRSETIIIESTYGGKDNIQPPRQECEKQFLDIVKKVIKRKGKLLIPVLGVGRSQEMMLILEQAYRNKHLPEDINIYIDGMVWDATAIYTTYPEYLSEGVRKLVFRKDHNPFLSDIFTRVGSNEERQEVISGPPCIILATSGMLTGGPSVEYLKALADNKRNCIVFVSYQAEGSLGNKIQKGWKEIPLEIVRGKREILEVELEVHSIEGFSAHSDRNQLINFAHQIKPRPQKIIINHGEASKAIELTKYLHKHLKCETLCPRNLDAIRLR